MNTETKSATRNNILWGIVGALGVAVIALGALLYTKSQSPTVPQTGAPSSTAPAASAPAPGAAPAAPAVGVAQPAKTPAKPGAKTGAATETAAPTPPRTADRAPASPTPAKAVCADCATVTAVTPVEREGQPTGAGAVAGGVLGALVGQQFGQGSGKTATTVIGAVGGGVAGHEVEKRMKKVTVYQVQLRMDDGSTRTIEQAQPASVGARVRVEGNALQPLN